MARPSDWHVLDLPRDPVPGEPGQVAVLARTVQRVADDAARAERDVRGLSRDSAVTSWTGLAAEVFRDALEQFPTQLRQLADSYDRAASALTRYSTSLDHAQDQADRALTHGRAARADIDTLTGQLSWANAAATTASHTADQLRAPLPPGAEPPDPDQVRTATRNAQTANARVTSLTSSLGSAHARLEAAKRMAHDAAQLRERAADTAADRLHDASDAGIEPTSFWDDFKGAASKLWNTTLTIAKVAVLVLGVIALVIGGPLAWVVVGLSVLLLADALAKVASGEGSWLDVALAALGLIPGVRGLTTLGALKNAYRSSGLLGAGTHVLTATRTALADMARGLRNGAGNVVGTLGSRMPVGDAGHLGRLPAPAPRAPSTPALRPLPPHLQPWLDQARDLGLATDPGTATFYSGGYPLAADAAEAHAVAQGASTIERTPGGAWLDGERLWDADSPVTIPEATQVWEHASRSYAELASGDVHVFVHAPRPDSAWNVAERPALETGLAEGRITSITVTDLVDGTTTVRRSVRGEERS